MSFSDLSILVIGDIMLDHYIYGSAKRLSPEAPVPIINVTSEKDMLGGCGNVITNLRSLEISSKLISLVGDDQNSKEINKKLKEINVDNDTLIYDKGISTTYKMRVIGNSQHIVRVDWDTNMLSQKSEKKIIDLLSKTLNNCDGIIISDYGKGVCSDKILRILIPNANKKNIPVFVDPKNKDWDKYSGSTFITPNTKEASELLSMVLKYDSDFEIAGKLICSRYSIQNCLITRGSEGMSLISQKKCIHIPSITNEVFDVSGAGDTVIACLAAAILKGLEISEAVKFSNKAAGIVVGHVGTTPITKKELGLG